MHYWWVRALLALLFLGLAGLFFIDADNVDGSKSLVQWLLGTAFLLWALDHVFRMLQYLRNR